MTTQDNVYNHNLDNCVQSLTRWKKFILTNLEGEEREAELQKLTQVTKAYMETNNCFNKAENAIREVESHIGDANLDIKQVYQQKIKEQEDLEYSSDIWQCVFGDGDISEVRTKEKRLRDDQYVSCDDSILCSNVFVLPVDPVSQAPIRNPVRNLVCNHVYDSGTIELFLKQSKTRAQCPYIGCENRHLSRKDLQEDVGLKEQIERFLAENLDQEEENDSD